MIQSAVRYLDGFWKRHSGIKSAARALATAVVVAVLFELGLADVVKDVTPY